MTAGALGWMRELTHQQKIPVPWARMLRMGVAVVAPVAVAAVFGQLGIGLLCSIGALSATLADAEGPYRMRVNRVSITAASGTVGFLIGGLVFGHPVGTAIVVLAAGLVSGVVSVLGSVASVASLQFLLFVIVASGADFGDVPGWLPPVCFLVGAAWALALSLSGGIGRATAPERAAVAEVYRCLAVLMETSGGPQTEQARQDLTAAMNRAYDSVVSWRAAAGGREPRVRKLAALLNAVTPVVEATTALLRARVAIPFDLTARVRAMSTDIRRGGGAPTARGAQVGADPGARPETDPRVPGASRPGASGPDASRPDVSGLGTDGDGSPTGSAAEAPELDRIRTELDAIGEVMRARRGTAAREERSPSSDPSPVTRALRVGDLTDQTGAGHPAVITRLRSLIDAITAGPATWQPTLRLVLCLAVAELAARVDPVERPYWIALTVAVTLKPDFGSVFARAVQRGVGTIVGVVIGSGLLLLLPGHVGPIIAIGVFATALPLAQRRNYGMFATFLTPVIVLLLDLGRGGGPQLLLGRMLDTAIGCAIVLAVGYLPWPATWRSRSRFGERVAAAAGAVRDYAAAALGVDEDGGGRTPRRHAYRTLSDLRTVLQQALSEPPPVNRSASAWWPAVVALERMTDAVTAVMIGARVGRAQPDPVAAVQVVAALDALAERMRGASVGGAGAEPPEGDGHPGTGMERELPDDPALAGVVAELRVAQAVVAGPLG